MPVSAAAKPPARRYHIPIPVLPLVILPAIAVLLHNQMSAWGFMWSLAFSIFAGLKWLTWCQAPGPRNPQRSVAYLLAWPGMDAESFLNPQLVPSRPSAREWTWASFKTLIGILLIWVVCRLLPSHYDLLRGWIALLGLIFLLHFGSFHLISLLWRTVGICAVPIMEEPMRSKNLSEFWGKRWNLGFRQLAHDLVFRPLHRQIGVAAAGFLVFLLSGLVHDFVISFPARGGYGLPTGYFTLQGLGVALERSRAGRVLGLQRGLHGWLFMFVMTAGPVFWLFHPPFVLRIIIPFMHAIHAI